MPGGGLTGVIFAGGVQAVGTVGSVPTVVPAVTAPFATGAVVGGAVVVVVVAAPLEHAAPISAQVASRAGNTALRRIMLDPLW